MAKEKKIYALEDLHEAAVKFGGTPQEVRTITKALRTQGIEESSVKGALSDALVFISDLSGGKTGLARELIGLGADVGAEDNAALAKASKADDPGMVKLLIKNGADGGARNGEIIREAWLDNHTEIAGLLEDSVNAKAGPARQVRKPKARQTAKPNL